MFSALALAHAHASAAGLSLCRDGKPAATLVVAADATPAEQSAARELGSHLKQITGADFIVATNPAALPAPAILVGPGAAASKAFPEVVWRGLGAETTLIRCDGTNLLLAGGRPRGTLYAVSSFLQDQLGVRWWTPWAARIPEAKTLVVTNLDRRLEPAFEYREPFWFHAFDGRWAALNRANGHSARLGPEWGGRIQYLGFVHTFFPLVPPQEHFQAHPEWYSLLKGKRTADGGQLCLSNPELRDFVTGQVKGRLQASPEAGIVSVSQNDWHGACQCDGCRTLETRYGAASGALLDFVNDVAGRLEPEFPAVALDTLAYQYTRAAPTNITPRSNVIVRLCSIECDFRAPLDQPSNAAFARDIRDWSKVCNRLYVWDYTTDFAHYIQPHPNWFALGSNVRFFHQHHVRGLFEQGAYQSHGAEMAELRAWLLAQLLWNPYQDDRRLLDEFLDGYYGPAAPPIRRYLELMHAASAGFTLGCFTPTDTPFHRFATLAKAERLWQQAEELVKNTPDQLWRVRLAHLPVRYVWLVRWPKLQEECRAAGADWPLPSSRKAVAEAWLAVATGPGPAGWSRITHLNESGLTPEDFVRQVGQD